jgi:hypothetical protein
MMEEFVCITSGVWWHNALWNVGQTVIYDKNRIPKLPLGHFVSLKKGEIGLIEYAKKEFDYDMPQNFSTYEMIEMLGKLRASKTAHKRQQNRIDVKRERKERQERMDEFIERGTAAPPAGKRDGANQAFTMT